MAANSAFRRLALTTRHTLYSQSPADHYTIEKFAAEYIIKASMEYKLHMSSVR